jgi:hypothetical protein
MTFAIFNEVVRQNDLTVPGVLVTERVLEGTNDGRAKALLLTLVENAEIRGLDVARKVVRSCFDNFIFTISAIFTLVNLCVK